ncbi:hypothetical protein AB0J81_30695 [Streptomyces bobili]|uniref:hypothetical protein n=1 Tax=Streptomyces bobili TaxID=67280 RepID=UPI003440339D
MLWAAFLFAVAAVVGAIEEEVAQGGDPTCWTVRGLREGPLSFATAFQAQREVDATGSAGGGLDVDDGDVVDEVGHNDGTVASEEVDPRVARHGATTVDVVKSLEQAWPPVGDTLPCALGGLRPPSAAA